jgi:hypothetical protein
VASRAKTAAVLITLKEVGRYAETNPATATISWICVSKKGNLLALNVMAGNRTETRILDASTLKPKIDVKLPLGSGYIAEFSEDGKSDATSVVAIRLRARRMAKANRSSATGFSK